MEPHLRHLLLLEKPKNRVNKTQATIGPPETVILPPHEILIVSKWGVLVSTTDRRYLQIIHCHRYVHT